MVNKAVATATTIVKPFHQLAPHWNKVLMTSYRNAKGEEGDHFPQLKEYEECILHECVKNTYDDFIHIHKMNTSIPVCVVCANMARQSQIMMMARPHGSMTIQERINKFYQEMVPEIENHFHRVHNNNNVQ